MQYDRDFFITGVGLYDFGKNLVKAFLDLEDPQKIKKRKNGISKLIKTYNPDGNDIITLGDPRLKNLDEEDVNLMSRVRAAIQRWEDAEDAIRRLTDRMKDMVKDEREVPNQLLKTMRILLKESIRVDLFAKRAMRQFVDAGLPLNVNSDGWRGGRQTLEEVTALRDEQKQRTLRNPSSNNEGRLRNLEQDVIVAQMRHETVLEAVKEFTEAHREWTEKQNAKRTDRITKREEDRQFAKDLAGFRDFFDDEYAAKLDRKKNKEFTIRKVLAEKLKKLRARRETLRRRRGKDYVGNADRLEDTEDRIKELESQVRAVSD